MTYYHDLITQKSWEELQQLKHHLPFVLIGGWATYLYTKTLKSKDIDILITFDQLATIQKHYQLVKNERLSKYEAIKGEVQIDIYLPHYSNIGIPVEHLIEQTQSVEGFTLIRPEYLIALKLFTLSQRGRSPKGHKDFLDLVGLLRALPASQEPVVHLLTDYQLTEALDTFHQFLTEITEIPELAINPHQYAKFRRTLQL